jgi:pyruvyltransferase
MTIKSFSNIYSELTYHLSVNSNFINVLSFYTKNFGDYYNKPLLESVLNKNTHIVDINIYNKLSFLESIYNKKDLIVAIGSILHFAPKDSVVWGTGSIWYNSVPNYQPKEILAVRGRLTQKNLKDNGFKYENIIGDPGLLLNKYMDRENLNLSKKYKLGIIPHHSEKNLSLFNELKLDKDILILDIEDTEKFIQNICLCENIASSSLHGLIFSDSLGIPNTWLKFSDRIHGQHFKFHDYYSSIYNTDISNMKALEINSYKDLPKIYSTLSKTQIDLDIDKLEKVLKDYYNV